jgi:hypothetical protein
MLLVRAEDEIPSVWTGVWDRIEPEEEARLTELEEQRKGLQAQAAELVENASQAIPPKKARGHGFFARKHTGGGASAVEATVETIDRLVISATEVTRGFVEWVTGMGGVFESIHSRAKALQDEDKMAVEKVAELVKLAIIITKDMSSFFKDLRQWYRFVNGVMNQSKKGAKPTKQQLTKGAKEALEKLQHVRKETHDNVKKKLQQALEWGIRNNAEVVETCEMVLKMFTAEELPLDEDIEGDGGGSGDCEGANADGVDAEGGAGGGGGRDFMSDMKSYCFQKFGKFAEEKLNKRAKIYDKVQIHLLCEYGACHVPEGMPKFLN